MKTYGMSYHEAVFLTPIVRLVALSKYGAEIMAKTFGLG